MLGTRFSVRQETGTTLVTVIEARVALHPAQASGAPAILNAGETARFDRHRWIARQQAKPADTAWVRGMLVADDMDLATWVAELARYRSDSITYDPAVRALRISGTFPLADTDRALAALASTLPVRLERQVDRDGMTRLVIRPR